jgi:hypothetical protein
VGHPSGQPTDCSAALQCPAAHRQAADQYPAGHQFQKTRNIENKSRRRDVDKKHHHNCRPVIPHGNGKWNTTIAVRCIDQMPMTLTASQGEHDRVTQPRGR